jgi:hypothetical protein
MKLRRVVVAAALLAAFTAGCGEKPMVTVYKKGVYQGKPDTQPWNGGQFKGDRLAWEKAIKARNNNQSEYSRTVSN